MNEIKYKSMAFIDIHKQTCIWHLSLLQKFIINFGWQRLDSLVTCSTYIDFANLCYNFNVHVVIITILLGIYLYALAKK